MAKTPRARAHTNKTNLPKITGHTHTHTRHTLTNTQKVGRCVPTAPPKWQSRNSSSLPVHHTRCCFVGHVCFKHSSDFPSNSRAAYRFSNSLIEPGGGSLIIATM